MNLAPRAVRKEEAASTHHSFTLPDSSSLSTETSPVKHSISNVSLLWTHVLLWKTEIFSWIASLLFFVSIIAVLVTFNGRPLPDLPLNITLNAIVGFLATFGEFLFMIPVASALGQSKWLRVLRKRPADDFRMLDEASRGSWGSFLLLARGKGGYVRLFHRRVSTRIAAARLHLDHVCSRNVHNVQYVVPFSNMLTGSPPPWVL
jgi:hypothetical protein